MVSKREVYSKTYLLPDGTYQYVSYAEPIHYKDSTGNYVEINNTISAAVRAEGYRFANTANSWDAHFSDRITDQNAVKMTDGDYQIAFSFEGQATSAPVTKTTDLGSRAHLSQYHKELAADDRAVLYADVMNQVDIAYTVRANALKEDIILKAKPASGVFKFKLTTNGLILKEKTGAVGLYNAAGKEIFEFAPLYMEDANGKRSNGVSLAYSSIKNGYTLTITADTGFLNAADTVYPVVIDPSVMVTGADVTYDTFVGEQYPDENYYLSQSLWTGGELDNNVERTYIKFSLPTNIEASRVISANIYLLKKSNEVPTIQAYGVTGGWSSNSITWNNKPSYSCFGYSAVATNTVGNWYGLDVTTLVRYWLKGTLTNYGVVLKEPSETYRLQKTEFYSSDAPSPNKPELVINYSDAYYGSRPYQNMPLDTVNCMGYALEIERIIKGDDFGAPDEALDGYSLAIIEDYAVYCIESYMSEEDVGVGSANWKYSSYEEEVDEGWYKIVLRFGLLDNNGNGVYDYGEDTWDFHFYYQTSSGDWAHKLSTDPSEPIYWSAHEDPTSSPWEGSDGLFYTTEGRFYQIRDIRENNWA